MLFLGAKVDLVADANVEVCEAEVMCCDDDDEDEKNVGIGDEIIIALLDTN